MAIPTRATLWLSRKDLCVFLLYVLLLCFTIHFYHPWEDEGRSWMIARTYDIPSILFRVLRYEGHPSLWYLVLWLPSHLHMAYRHITWISSAFAVSGIYLLLRHSPFPFFLRALLPFGFALQYQYAVVARSYALFPVLGFLCAYLYRKKQANPVAMGLALALFANITVYSTIVATGFAVCYWWKLANTQPDHNAVALNSPKTLIGPTIFAASLALAICSVWPHPYLRARIIQALAHGQSINVVTLPSQTPLPSNPPNQTQSKLQSTADAPPSYTRRLIARVVPVLADSVSSSHALAFAFEALVMVYLWRSNHKLLLLPLLLLLVSLLVGYEQIWHLQMLWITILLVLWMAWNPQESPVTPSMQFSVAAFLALLCLLQLSWTAGAIHYEMHHSTYPADEAAGYVTTLPRGNRIGGTGLAFTLRPYFLQDLFAVFSETELPDLAAFRPETFIGDSKMSPSDRDRLFAAGYRETRSFCGAPYYPIHPAPTVCLIFFGKTE